MKKLFLLLILYSFFAVNSNAADTGNGLRLTALDHYVNSTDSNYHYEVINTVEGDGYTTFILEMISQQWLTEAEVNLPIWEHFMVVVLSLIHI